MKVIHFSAQFAGSEIRFHGEFVTSYIKREDIVSRAKAEMSKKLPWWNRRAEDVVFFEVYRFGHDGTEEVVFQWNK
jgi:hypothetical protein